MTAYPPTRSPRQCIDRIPAVAHNPPEERAAAADAVARWVRDNLDTGRRDAAMELLDELGLWRRLL